MMLEKETESESFECYTRSVSFKILLNYAVAVEMLYMQLDFSKL